MVIPFRHSVLAALGTYYPPDSLVAKVVPTEAEQPPNLPFWAGSISLFDPLDLTTAQVYIRFRLPLQLAGG
jgi:hypothetical protein